MRDIAGRAPDSAAQTAFGEVRGAVEGHEPKAHVAHSCPLFGRDRRRRFGQDDIFFTREGGEACLADLPHAEMHRLQSGHFAVEDQLAYISDHMKSFYFKP
jgi:hypothetical protein